MGMKRYIAHAAFFAAVIIVGVVISQGLSVFGSAPLAGPLALTPSQTKPHLEQVIQFPSFRVLQYDATSSSKDFIGLKYANGMGMIDFSTHKFKFTPALETNNKKDGLLARHSTTSIGALDKGMYEERRRVSVDLGLSAALGLFATSSVDVRVFGGDDHFDWYVFHAYSGKTGMGIARHNKVTLKWTIFNTMDITGRNRIGNPYDVSKVFNGTAYVAIDGRLYYFDLITDSWKNILLPEPGGTMITSLAVQGSLMYASKWLSYTGCNVDIIDTKTNKSVGLLSQVISRDGFSSTSLRTQYCSFEADNTNNRLVFVGSYSETGTGKSYSGAGVGVFDTIKQKFSHFPYAELYQDYKGYNGVVSYLTSEGAMISADDGVYYWSPLNGSLKYIARSLKDSRDYYGDIHPRPVFSGNRAYVTHVGTCYAPSCKMRRSVSTTTIYALDTGKKIDEVIIDGVRLGPSIRSDQSGEVYANGYDFTGKEFLYHLNIEKRAYEKIGNGVYQGPLAEGSQDMKDWRDGVRKVSDPTQTYKIIHRDSISGRDLIFSINTKNSSSTVVVKDVALKASSYVNATPYFDQHNPHVAWFIEPDVFVRYDLDSGNYEKIARFGSFEESSPFGASDGVSIFGGDFAAGSTVGGQVIYRIVR